MDKYQVMPPLSAEEYTALKADIKQRGVLVPIELDENGNVLDGHHRLRVCQELKITDYPKVIRAGLAEEEKRAHARAINLTRRHLTSEQKREQVKQQLLETPHFSDRTLAGWLGVDHSTVSRQRKKLEKSNELSQCDSSFGADGKIRPREAMRHEVLRKPVSVYLPTEREERLIKKPEVVARMAEDELSSVIYANRRINQEKKAARKSTAGIELSEDDCRLICGDIKNGYPEIPSESVSCIITDAPYGKEYAELYSHLGQLAARTLKPGGSCLVMTGQVALPEAMSRLCEHLRYHWLICCLTPRSAPSLPWLHVSPFYKAVLWFTKGVYSGDLQSDVLTAPPDKDGADRDYHHWGQSESVFTELTTRFSDPQQIILDPYVGGGTGAVCAIKARRKFIGCDISSQCVADTRRRVLDALMEDGADE